MLTLSTVLFSLLYFRHFYLLQCIPAFQISLYIPSISVRLSAVFSSVSFKHLFMSLLLTHRTRPFFFSCRLSSSQAPPFPSIIPLFLYLSCSFSTSASHPRLHFPPGAPRPALATLAPLSSSTSRTFDTQAGTFHLSWKLRTDGGSLPP